MARRRMRGVWASAAVLVGAVLGGCSDGGGPSGTASRAASAAASVGSSLASQAASALASATAAAGRTLDGIKGGTEARGEARVGATGGASEGRKAVEVTASNPTSKARTYAVQIDFRGAGGDLLDAVVVTIGSVPPHGSKSGTALSNRKLSGDVKADVARAVRY
ncbi:hypothetical protein AB0C59_27465 [Streptomyces sp. NPDC048664]|uniref:hypothetical protein n=1 Tax=Streptomyces sp. NPDC048664 TaxID=3154505 RepID=UPI0034375C9F